MNKILCPIDFSDCSLNAIEFAVEIGKKFHSSITLIHIFTESEFNEILDTESVGKSFKELLAMANTRLKELAESINAEYKGNRVSVDYYLGLGNLNNSILEYGEKGQYDLYVMGTTGVSKGNGIFFGSNTEDVIEKAKVPILTVPEDATFNGFNSIVYASDFMQEDRMAIQEVISFATIFDARINVLHINEGDNNAEYDNFIEDLKSFIQYKKINFVNKNVQENISLSIEEFMEQEKSDLLVVFKRHRNFVGSIFHKSITKTLSYSTNKPFFVLKFRS